MKIKIRLTDDNGQEYDGSVNLTPVKTVLKPSTRIKRGPNWKKESTAEKILALAEEGFFKQPRKIREIIDKLAEKDYHFKAPDLTLPLRNIVRNGKLKKTKGLPTGQKSKLWLYLEV